MAQVPTAAEPSRAPPRVPTTPAPRRIGVRVTGPSPPHSGRTDSPMLGYIFDTHSSLKQHHHHDHRWGPHFEGAEAINCTNITVQVSWVRRKNGDLQLLTVGLHTYSGDSRYTMEFQYPNNWRLQIKYANKMDEGLYECQISTHPPKVIQIYMHINGESCPLFSFRGHLLAA
ncbi:hypothetical protein J437_LFUL010968 [Ladona fulva]|uniref:Ig-like domain-containing protein n=1 Tax=Ladona fulva TaxID=123851 RepID=A0A8K0KDM4_LADFU|nr:hypothetical protein J437_LFUL010968 [Ladona fulva]